MPNFVQSKVKTAKRNYHSNNIFSDKQSFYKEINTLLDKKGKHSTNINIRNESGNLISEPLEVAELLNAHFVKQPAPDPPENEGFPRSQNIPKLQFQEVSSFTILKELAKLNPTKRGGPLGIPASYYKCLYQTVVPALTIIIHNSINKNTFPHRAYI